MAIIFNTFDKEFISNLCKVNFILTYAYQNTEEYKYYNLISVGILKGNKLLNRFFNILKNIYIKESYTITYRSYVEK